MQGSGWLQCRKSNKVIFDIDDQYANYVIIGNGTQFVYLNPNLQLPEGFEPILEMHLMNGSSLDGVTSDTIN
jgi:hypothetical protein